MKFFKSTYAITGLIFWILSLLYFNEDWIFWTLTVGCVLSFGIAEILFEVKSLKTLNQKNDDIRK